MAEGVEHLWATADLAAALLHSTRLPGEPTGPPPWPDYLDGTYRRQTAAAVLGRRAAASPDCFGPLAFVAGREDNESVRLRCLEQLFEARYPHLSTLPGSLVTFCRCERSHGKKRLPAEAVNDLPP